MKKKPIETKQEIIDKENKVVDLRRAGLTWSRIALEVGYADHSGAFAAYKRALSRTLEEPIAQVRQAEIDRLDRLQVAVWQKAMKGDNASIMTIVRIIEQRVKILGLASPEKSANTPDIWDELAAEILK